MTGVFQAALERIARPIGQARSLPSDFYRSADVLERENRSLFRDHWICVALDSDLAEPGSLHPVTLAGQPILLVRGQDERVRAFHNVCSHRGALLAEAPCTGLRRITCPYHAWTYGLDGQLEAAPRFSVAEDKETLDVAQLGLREVRSGIWNHLVFVNLSGGAPDLADWLAPLEARWRAYDIAGTGFGGETRYDIAANWKLVLENFLESYHLPTVHKGLNSYSPLDDHEIVVTDLFMGQISHGYRPSDAASGRLPTFPDLPPERESYAEYLLVFPNLMLSCAPDHFRATVLTPAAPGRTLQRWAFFFHGDAGQTAREGVVERIRAVNDEDIGILERLQAGRASDGYDGGPFSPLHEPTVHNFQRLVAEALAGARP